MKCSTFAKQQRQSSLNSSVRSKHATATVNYSPRAYEHCAPNNRHRIWSHWFLLTRELCSRCRTSCNAGADSVTNEADTAHMLWADPEANKPAFALSAASNA